MQTTEAFLAVFESEPWHSGPAALSAHAEASDLERESFVTSANAIYSLISTMEAVTMASLAARRMTGFEAEPVDFGEHYRRWLEVCDKTIADLGLGPGDASLGEAADELLRNVEEARCLLEARELEGSMRPIDEILPLARGNPRPERYGR